MRTLGISFFILNPFKLIAYCQSGILETTTLITGLICLSALWLGLRLGASAHDRLPVRAFNLIILGMALEGSLRLVIGRH